MSARAKGVAKAAKTAVDGAIGMGQAATGVRPSLPSPLHSPLSLVQSGGRRADNRAQEQSSLGTDQKHPGPDSRTHIEAEEEKGRKEGLAHKGEQQGAI